MASAAEKASGYNSDGQALSPRSVLGKKIWLPKALYAAVPFFYLIGAVCALLATLYVAEWFWLVPHYLLLSVACVHMAVFVFRRRRKKANPEPPSPS